MFLWIILASLLVTGLVVGCVFLAWKLYQCWRKKHNRVSGEDDSSYSTSSSSDTAVRRSDYPVRQYVSYQNEQRYYQVNQEILLRNALDQFQQEQEREIYTIAKELYEYQKIIQNDELQEILFLSVIFLENINEIQSSFNGMKMLEDFRDLLRNVRDEIRSALNTRRTIRVAILQRNGNEIRGMVAQFQA